MNGVHDMGGMQGFGPVVPEPDEPQFHHAWERRVFALTLAVGATGQWNLDQTRSARESLPPARYLASSYYRIWFDALIKLMQERGLVSADELADGRAGTAPISVSVLPAAKVAAVLSRGNSTQRPVTAAARFGVGDGVRTKNLNPPTHTRLPRYCRDKPGTIVRLHGPHVFPDTHACGQGERAQWLYTVRFDSHDLWGADTTCAAVHADCWEPYLEPR